MAIKKYKRSDKRIRISEKTNGTYNYSGELIELKNGVHTDNGTLHFRFPMLKLRVLVKVIKMF